jgi:hypothetical protein
MIRYPDTMSAARLWSVGLVAAAISAAGTSGCATRRAQGPAVVVLEVRGEPDPVWQERVAELAEARRFEVIPAEQYWVMAARLGARPLTARNVARVADALGASAVVHGRMTGKRSKKSRRQVMTLYVRNGENGRVVEKHRLVLRRGTPSRRGKAALERRLLAKIAPPEPPDARPVAAEPVRAEPKPARAVRAEPKPAKPVRAEPKPAKPVRAEPKPATARVEAAPGRGAPVPAAKAKKVVEVKREPPRKSRSARAPGPAAEPPPPVEYDENGQAIDDEAPPRR